MLLPDDFFFFEETCSLQKRPVPGTPTEYRFPLVPTVALAPLGPKLVEKPRLEILKVTPGATLIRLKNLKLPIFSPPASFPFAQPACDFHSRTSSKGDTLLKRCAFQMRNLCFYLYISIRVFFMLWNEKRLCFI